MAEKAVINPVFTLNSSTRGNSADLAKSCVSVAIYCSKLLKLCALSAEGLYA